MNETSLPSFTFEHQGITHQVYTLGEGPGVLLMHELPGMTTQCLDLARLLAAQGYKVYLPLFFGRIGRRSNWLGNLWCIRHEFKVWAARETSPIVDWLRALSERTWRECGGRGVGAIGMCLTGNFAIALLAQPWVQAPVSCQPTLPFPVLGDPAALALSPDDLAAVKAEASRREAPALVATRFAGDRLCPARRFRTLKEELGDKVEQLILPGKGHATLTDHFVDKQGHPTREALDRILEFLHQRLR
jgi:dienelactone hydrolase